MAKRIPDKRILAISDDLHSLKEWVAVYEEEYGHPKEVVRTINANITRIAKKLVDV